MNILFLAAWYPSPPDNGAKLRVYHLLRALAQRHDVTLLSFAFDTAKPDSPSELDTFCRSVQVIEQHPFQVNRAGLLTRIVSPRPAATRPIPAMSSVVQNALREDEYDVVIASTEMMADYALMAPPSALKVLEEHNSITRRMHDRYLNASGPPQSVRCWASWQKRRRYEAGYYRNFDLITMVSELDREAMLDTVGDNSPQTEVVPNGVDCEHNRPGLACSRPHTLVYNGSLTYSANFDAMQWFLTDIYPLIKQSVPDVSLSITGPSQGVDLAGLALDESVTLTGYVDDIRIPVAEASVCAVPIRLGGGTRLKILEAMALGTPVVATSKGAEGLELLSGEHLLIADDPQSFASSVISLLGDVKMRSRLAVNARQLVVSRYEWQPIGERFVSLVESAAENGNRR